MGEQRNESRNQILAENTENPADFSNQHEEAQKEDENVDLSSYKKIADDFLIFESDCGANDNKDIQLNSHESKEIESIETPSFGVKKQGKKWKVSRNVCGQTIHGGMFKNFDEARIFSDEMVRKLKTKYGEKRLIKNKMNFSFTQTFENSRQISNLVENPDLTYGVYWREKSKGWRPQRNIGGSIIYGKIFKNRMKALRAADNLVLEHEALHNTRSTCKLNFPKDAPNRKNKSQRVPGVFWNGIKHEYQVYRRFRNKKTYFGGAFPNLEKANETSNDLEKKYKAQIEGDKAHDFDDSDSEDVQLLECKMIGVYQVTEGKSIKWNVRRTIGKQRIHGGNYDDLETAKRASDGLVRAYEEQTGIKTNRTLNFSEENNKHKGGHGVYWKKGRWSVQRKFNAKTTFGGYYNENELEQALLKSDSLVYQKEQKTGEKTRHKLNFPARRPPQFVTNGKHSTRCSMNLEGNSADETRKRKRREIPENQ